MGRLRQGALRRSRGRARLSLALHSPRRHLQSASDRLRRDRRHLPLQGLPPRGPERQRVMTLAPHEFIRRFLLHVLPQGFHRIRHYGLLASSARKARYRARPRTACRGAVQPARACGSVRTTRLAPALSLLRRTHAHHRDVRTLDAAARAAPRSRRNRDAVMTRHGKRSPRAATLVVPATAIRAPVVTTVAKDSNLASGQPPIQRLPDAKSSSPHPPRRHRRPDAAIVARGQMPKSP